RHLEGKALDGYQEHHDPNGRTGSPSTTKQDEPKTECQGRSNWKKRCTANMEPVAGSAAGDIVTRISSTNVPHRSSTASSRRQEPSRRWPIAPPRRPRRTSQPQREYRSVVEPE